MTSDHTLVWNGKDGSLDVRCDGYVLAQVAEAAVSGYRRYSWGGVEIGGVLFGTRDADGVHIRAFRPAECEHDFGPAFELSDKDVPSFDRLVASPTTDPELAGLTAVGWYQSVSRREVALSERSRAIFPRFFKDLWKVALVVKRSKADPLSVGVFHRHVSGRVELHSATQEFTLEQLLKFPPPPPGGTAAMAAGVDSSSAAQRKQAAPKPQEPGPPAEEVALGTETAADFLESSASVEPETAEQPVQEELAPKAAPIAPGSPVAAAPQVSPEAEPVPEPESASAAAIPSAVPAPSLEAALPPSLETADQPSLETADEPAFDTADEPASVAASEPVETLKAAPVPAGLAPVSPAASPVPAPSESPIAPDPTEALLELVAAASPPPLAFLGLNGNPFSAAPDPRFFYASPFHREALAVLLHRIQERVGFLGLVGEPGTGKSIVVERLAELLKRQSIPVACLLNSRISVPELFELLNHDLNLKCARPSKTGVLIALNEYLLAQLQAGRTAALVVDNAQKLSIPVIEEIELLGNLETRHGKLLQVVFAGQPSFDRLLDAPELRGLRQRMMMQARLYPLDAAQTAAFIEFRLAQAGLQNQGIFPAEVMAGIYSRTRGLPRLINTLCGAILAQCLEERARTATLDMMDAVSRELALEHHATASA